MSSNLEVEKKLEHLGNAWAEAIYRGDKTSAGLINEKIKETIQKEWNKK